jgi:hypothetical protein
MDLQLERLYLLYQAGSKTDGRKNSYTLQVAQAVGNDLTREEFESLHHQVKQIESQLNPSTQTKKFQESLWTLPDEWNKKRETDFQPTRTATNEPVQYEDSSPASLQEFLKTKSLEDVKHDSTLRNAWHAAQSNKLEELTSTDNLWTTSTDRDELANELQSLPASIGVDSLGWSLNNLRVANNEGKLDEELAKERKKAESDLPSAPTYNAYDAEAMRKRILSNQGSEFSFIDKSLREDVHGGHSLADIAKMDKPLREDAARAWVDGFRKKHEDSIPQAIVDRRMKGLVASQLPARKESKQLTSQELLHSVMKTGFSSRDTAVPPVQVHYSPFSNAQTSRSNAQATRNATASRLNSNRSPAIQPRAEKGSVDASLSVHHSMSTDTNAPQRDLRLNESAHHSIDANANQPVRSPENTDSNPSVQPSYPGSETEGLPDNEEEVNSFSSLDSLQLMLDAVGVFEPTPFADVTNAGISLTRAIAEPANAGRHLKNAGLSLISTLPYLGDVAKLAKGYGKTGKVVGNSIDAFASSKAPKLLEWFGASGKKQYSKASKDTNENQSSSTGGFLGSLAGIFGHGNAGKSNKPQQQHSPGSGSSGNGAGGDGSSGGSGSPPSFGGNLSGGPFGMMGGGPGEGLSRLTIVIGAAIAAFRLLNGWVNKTAERGKAMVEANREMALYSGQMSTAMLQYDNREVLRKMDEAAYLGSSGASLAQSQSDLEDSRSDHNKPYARTWNNIQSYTNQAATLLSEILQFADPIRALLERIYSAVDDGKKKDLDSNDAFEEMIRQNNAIPLANPKPNVKLPANMNNAIRKGGGLP